ncbi:hypothetical protein CALVIDRAFT_567629 [Calocera viscosa TUFC12733]|uniref:F-box domain-containing protein n=1 Tax=Calocera viscosa (strain TUFC12733) TaxID=1330018 RepID=A0A167I2A3_CALVF|nr:hypothetical protein CALVIDRAFT_567629 [Calocera viscosa TUFC12733]
MHERQSRHGVLLPEPLKEMRTAQARSLLLQIRTVCQDLRAFDFSMCEWLNLKESLLVPDVMGTVCALKNLEELSLFDVRNLEILDVLSQPLDLQKLVINIRLQIIHPPPAFGALALRQLVSLEVQCSCDWLLTLLLTCEESRLKKLDYRILPVVDQAECDLAAIFSTLGRSFRKLNHLSLSLLFSPSCVGGSALKELLALHDLRFFECRVHGTIDDEVNDSYLTAIAANCPLLAHLILHWVHVRQVTMLEAASWSHFIPTARLSLNAFRLLAKLTRLRDLSLYLVSPTVDAGLSIPQPSHNPPQTEPSRQLCDGFLAVHIHLPGISDRDDILELKTVLATYDTWEDIDEQQEAQNVYRFLNMLWPRKRISLRVKEGFSAVWAATEKLFEPLGLDSTELP